jgi:hypothetical protein
LVDFLFRLAPSPALHNLSTESICFLLRESIVAMINTLNVMLLKLDLLLIKSGRAERVNPPSSVSVSSWAGESPRCIRLHPLTWPLKFAGLVHVPQRRCSRRFFFRADRGP